MKDYKETLDKYDIKYHQGNSEEVNQGIENLDKIFEEWLNSMRSPTPEEWDSVNNYIESISRPTGINIFDLMNEEQREYDMLYEPTYNPEDGGM